VSIRVDHRCILHRDSLSTCHIRRESSPERGLEAQDSSIVDTYTGHALWRFSESTSAMDDDKSSKQLEAHSPEGIEARSVDWKNGIGQSTIIPVMPCGDSLSRRL
jgi:hypothetical protein